MTADGETLSIERRQAEPPRTRFGVLSPLLIASATIAMLVWTRNTWADCLYDFGSQLYYPWRMRAGDRLYVDIAYFNGPLSQYFNTLMFACFGVSLRTLQAVNFAILSAVLVMVYRVARSFGDARSATAGTLLVVLVFAFSQYVGLANYNWVCPYTHEVTHGVALAIGAVAAIGRYVLTDRRRWVTTAGLLLGLSALTKAEVFAPAAGAVALAVVLRRPTKFLWSPLPVLRERVRVRVFSFFRRSLDVRNHPHRSPLPGYRETEQERSRFTPANGRRISVALFILIAAAAVPISIAYFFLSHSLGRPVALRAIAGSWVWVFDRRISQLAFYRQGLGVDDVAGNLRKMLTMLLGYAAVFGWISVAARARRSVGIAMIALLAGVAILKWPRVPWQDVARPWPVIVGAVFLMSAWRSADPKWLLRCTWAALSVGLMGKMLLNARIGQYGFTLAMPAAVAMVDAVLVLLPAWVGRSASGKIGLAEKSLIAGGGSFGLPVENQGFRTRLSRISRAPGVFSKARRGDAAVAWAGGFVVLVTVVAVHLWWCGTFISQDRVVVGTGPDALLASARGLDVEAARQAIIATPFGTMAVMPQGLMLNYLTRRVNPSPYVNLMPPEMTAAARGEVLRTLQCRPPDQILAVQKDWAAGAFRLTEGDYHYGQDVARWVQGTYKPMARFALPNESGLLLLKRQ